jgi:hypothetical protein
VDIGAVADFRKLPELGSFIPVKVDEEQLLERRFDAECHQRASRNERAIFSAAVDAGAGESVDVDVIQPPG